MLTADTASHALPSEALERLAASGDFEEGMARRSFLDHAGWRQLFDHLNSYQDWFLSTDSRWRPELEWPRDALGWWSRRWEYVYALIAGQPKAGEKALDAGCGVTFFPFYLIKNGLEMECCDMDDRLIGAFQRAKEVIGFGPGFKVADLAELPYETAEFDTVYCISVLEHTTAWDKILSEFRRVLKPGGKLVLTCDVDLGDPSSSYSLKRIEALIQELGKQFQLSHFRAVADVPEDALTTHSCILEKAELETTDVRGLKDAVNKLRHPRRYAWARQRLANEPNLAVFCIHGISR